MARVLRIVEAPLERYRGMPWGTICWWALSLSLLIVLRRQITGILDWNAYLRAALVGFLNDSGVANPPYVGLFLYPFARLPSVVGLWSLGLLTLGSLYAITRLTRVNKWFLLISEPVLWVTANGQLDAFVALGVALGYWFIKEKRPIWQGAATLLLCAKPHIGLPLAVFYLLWQRDWRSIIVSGAVALGSMPFLGLWPIQYARNLLSRSEGGCLAGILCAGSVGLFPWGLLFWPLVVLPVYRGTQRVGAIVAATMLSMDYAAWYSALAVMAVPLPLWVYPPISARLLGMGTGVVQFALIAVIVYPILIYVVRHRVRLLQGLGFGKTERSIQDG